MMTQTPLTPTQAVELINFNFELNFESLVIVGEVIDFRVSKQKWVYFNLKDDNSSVKFFGTIYNLPGPIEVGMLLTVKAYPRLHKMYGFSFQVESINYSGQGTINKAYEILKQKLTAEGLFSVDNKKALPKYPQRIGLITAKNSAACADFIKIATTRWPIIEIDIFYSSMQGSDTVESVSRAIEYFMNNTHSVDLVVITRGGGSSEDLSVFNSEELVRKLAQMSTPKVVAIGHEVDETLLELVADLRASTPSNSAELSVPDISEVNMRIKSDCRYFNNSMILLLESSMSKVSKYYDFFKYMLNNIIVQHEYRLNLLRQSFEQFNPNYIFKLGYSLAVTKQKTLTSVQQISEGQVVVTYLKDGSFESEVISVKGEL